MSNPASHAPLRAAKTLEPLEDLRPISKIASFIFLSIAFLPQR